MLELLAMVVLGLAWLVPNHYPPWTSFYNETAAGLALLLLALAVGRRWAAVRTPGAVWVLAGVAALPWLQRWTGQLHYASDAWVASAYLLGVAGAVATAHAWSADGVRTPAARLGGTLLVGGLLSAGLALVQAFQLTQLGIWSLDAVAGMRPYANLGQPNNLATLLGLSLLGLLLLREQERLDGRVAALLAVPLVLAAAATQSRTALLFGPAVLLLMVLARRRGLAWRTPLAAVAALVVAHIVLALLFPTLQQLVTGATAESLAERNAASPRATMWPLLLESLSRSPWSGYGWLQLGDARLAVAERGSGGGEFWMHAHNLFLDLLLWAGVPLGLLLGGLVVAWYATRLARVRTLEAVLGFAAVTLVGIHAMLELPHHYAYFLIPVGLWIGIVEATLPARTGRVPGWAGLAPTLAAAAIALLLWRDYPAVEDDFRLVRFENLRIGNVKAAQPAPEARFLDSLTGFLRFARTPPAPGLDAATLQRMETAVKRYPYANSMAQLAMAYALNGRLDDGIRLFGSIRTVHNAKTYTLLREQLRLRVADGEHGLAALDRAVPDAP